MTKMKIQKTNILKIIEELGGFFLSFCRLHYNTSIGYPALRSPSRIDG